MEVNKTIPIRCKGNRAVPFSKLKSFQGNLKEMSTESAEKLKDSILKHGWIAPVFVWDENYILDGHGRLMVLAELIKEGYEIGNIPVDDIEAKSKSEAGAMLLEINAKYQTMTGEGLYEFINDMEIDVEDIEDTDFPDIDMGEFMDEFVNEVPTQEQPEEVEPEKEKTARTCPHCGGEV